MYRRHMLAHSGSKPYKCILCDFRSSRKDSVSRHVRLRHSSQISMARVGPSSVFDVVQVVEQDLHGARVGVPNIPRLDQGAPIDPCSQSANWR